MKNAIRIIFMLYGLVIAMASAPVLSEASYSPYVGKTYPANLYWGDTHLHTNLSTDANLYGNKNLGPEEAYRFAKGEAVTAHNGMTARLQRPLDFIVVTDHAFNMGLYASLDAGDPILLNTPAGKLLYEQWQSIQQITDPLLRYKESDALHKKLTPFLQGEEVEGDQRAIKDDAFTASVWQRVTAAADRHNAPGKFTAFIGYEWTSMGVGTIHRNVIFKDGAERANQIVPFSSFDSMNPEDLWRFLENYEKTTGGEVFAIPHNGNLSEGRMFSLVDDDGRPLSKHYALARSRWEPLYETTQIKGDSEAHPLLSPDDEFADYETWNGYGLLENSQGLKIPGWLEKRQSEYARSALKLGLAQEASLGVNPFKFGMIGSTDSHTSLATADENNFWGKTTADEPTVERMFGPTLIGWSRPERWVSSGYTAVWAEENTRESLFAAMQRKEVYATTGPRITVRFFGGWDYEQNDALRPDVANMGYRKGVPMGGDLTHAPQGKAPNFLIFAVKDPDGANLDRIQVIKGWRDKKGELKEQIYDVALSNGRKENGLGNVRPVGSTVNVKDASYTNSIGDAEFATVWQDPDFDKDQLAFYYVRVLEIPTPRWTAYDARFFGIKDIPEHVPMVTQERAYTSPIWYGPPAKAGGE